MTVPVGVIDDIVRILFDGLFLAKEEDVEGFGWFGFDPERNPGYYGVDPSPTNFWLRFSLSIVIAISVASTKFCSPA